MMSIWWWWWLQLSIWSSDNLRRSGQAGGENWNLLRTDEKSRCFQVGIDDDDKDSDDDEYFNDDDKSYDVEDSVEDEDSDDV